MSYLDQDSLTKLAAAKLTNTLTGCVDVPEGGSLVRGILRIEGDQVSFLLGDEGQYGTLGIGRCGGMLRAEDSLQVAGLWLHVTFKVSP